MSSKFNPFSLSHLISKQYVRKKNPKQHSKNEVFGELSEVTDYFDKLEFQVNKTVA